MKSQTDLWTRRLNVAGSFVTTTTPVQLQVSQELKSPSSAVILNVVVHEQRALSLSAVTLQWFSKKPVILHSTLKQPLFQRQRTKTSTFSTWKLESRPTAPTVTAQSKSRTRRCSHQTPTSLWSAEDRSLQLELRKLLSAGWVGRKRWSFFILISPEVLLLVGTCSFSCDDWWAVPNVRKLFFHSQILWGQGWGVQDITSSLVVIKNIWRLLLINK